MVKMFFILFGVLAFCQAVCGQSVSKVWVADRKDGTYMNPVLHADYSDPDVCAVGDDFYMTASSFNCTPGLPILHSKDLVNSITSLSMERACGLLPYVTITVSSIFIGEIRISAFLW